MDRRFHLFAVVLLMCTFSSWINVSTDATSISIDNNAYSNIVVAISPDVPNTWAELIIQNIQLMIRRASSVLYRATKKRSYFKDVRILVPESWGNIRANVSTWETYSTADVRVSPAGSTYGDIPYTVQSGGCGQPGEYIHMTPDYLRTVGDANNSAVFGPPEKVFVHQWARLRYGVFEEYGQKGSLNYPVFFKPPNSAVILPNVCTDEVPDFTTKDSMTQGPCKINPATGVYDDNCVYEFKPDFLPESSLMSSYSISSVVDFCQDDQDLRHIYYAPSKQNAMCQSTSVWTIITRHPDFVNNNNPPNDIFTLEPTFQIVKSSGSRFVLVADTSGSMKDYNRIGRLYESSRRWIKYDIPDGSQLGLVEFETKAKILSPLVMIDGEASRQSLINRLPVNAVGGTCIGCGLLKALDVLRSGGLGGVILLLTDGEETDRPFINEVLPELMKANVRVVSIAFGRKAEEKIEDLATKTNGKSYFIDDNDASQGLNDAFIGSMTYQPAVPSDQIIVLLFQRQYQNVFGGAVDESFYVDYTVGRNLVFRIDYTQKSYLQGFNLKSPSGIIYTQLEYDDVAKVALFKLSEAEVGKWAFSLRLSSSTVDSLAVHVTSRTRSNTTAPITTECYVPDGNTIDNANTNPVRILAKVMQGNNPVIRARVKAYIEMPSGPIEIIELFDNGASADTLADDGIYSRYFTAASSQGRYTVECEIWDDGSAYINNGFLTNTARLAAGNPLMGRKSTSKRIGSFTRIADGGSFKITQPVASSVNSYPPSRVVDLVVIGLMNTRGNRSVTIRFTAPGEDLDSGTATSYEIRYSVAFDDLRPANFGSTGRNSTLVLKEDVVNGSLQPLASGAMQILTFLVDNSSYEAKTYFIALRALDRTGLAGQASNIIAAPFPAQMEEPSSSRLSTKAIVGIAIGSLLAVLLIAAISYLIAKKKYLSYSRADTRSKTP